MNTSPERRPSRI